MQRQQNSNNHVTAEEVDPDEEDDFKGMISGFNGFNYSTFDHFECESDEDSETPSFVISQVSPSDEDSDSSSNKDDESTVAHQENSSEPVVDQLTIWARELDKEQAELLVVIESTFEGVAGAIELFADNEGKSLEASKFPSDASSKSEHTKPQTTSQNAPITHNLYAGTGDVPVRYYEFILDNGSQVSVSHPRFLTNLRQGSGSYKGLSGSATKTSMEGILPGFFHCMASESARVNVLSQADVEDLYEVVYTPGVSYTVKMADRDLVFYRRHKLYVVDMSEWIRPGYKDNTHNMSFMTVAEREHLYTRKERERTLKAGEFVKNAGFPSRVEAIQMMRNGNIEGIPHTVSKVKAFYDIYGPLPTELRGKATNKKSSTTNHIDEGLKEQRKKQLLTSDVMFALGGKYLVSVIEPLELTITVPVKSRKIEALGKALMSQIHLLGTRGFSVTWVITDLEGGLVALKDKIPGVVIDVVGAGDHLQKTPELPEKPP